jgi:hypothetical protein
VQLCGLSVRCWERDQVGCATRSKGHAQSDVVRREAYVDANGHARSGTGGRKSARRRSLSGSAATFGLLTVTDMVLA